MRQHARFKQRHPDCLLLFRMGDFYELFGDDAVIANRILGITLTQRNGQSMAGVPYHALESYLRKLIEHGCRVAVCDQVQDPKEAKGVVERAVTRVVTPGTLVDESLLDDAAANQVAAVQFLGGGDASAAVIAVVEVSTGVFTVLDVDEGRIVDEIARLGPSELLYVETADGVAPPRVQTVHETVGCALTARPGWTFRVNNAHKTLCEHFGVTTLSGFGLADDDHAIGPAGALLQYLQETQTPEHERGAAADESTRPGLSHIRPPKRQATDEAVVIDATSLASLEIERTIRRGGVEGSLLWVLQRCKSPMGKRLLRQWLCYPLRDRAAIEARQSCVNVLLQTPQLAEQLGDHIAGVQDVARIVGRLAMRRATPRDLVALGQSVARSRALADLFENTPAFARQHSHLQLLTETIAPIAETIQNSCVESPPAHLREGGLFKDGVDNTLDEARHLQRDANSWLASYQKRLIEETGIASLKVGYNKVFGYYIEITHAHSSKAPESFTRKQTLKNAERYITPELKEFEEKVTTAETRAIEREKLLFERLCHKAAGVSEALSEYASIVAELDVLLCFAQVARQYGYVRPTIVDEPTIDIEQGRHPVLDRTLGEQFVPNDCTLFTNAGSDELSGGEEDPDEDGTQAQNTSATLALITGPNMAGKSTYIRQVALIVLLAHTGSFVPAESATIGLTDRIFTRIGASDELHAGQSTFMVEMTETANILHHATEHSIVILDEIGRGTSTLDGLSLAWAIAETIAHIKCRTLFATHYHELTTLADRLANVMNLHVAVREWHDEIIFLYRIVPGRTDRSYGIHVAKIAGLPSETVRRAHQLLETLAVKTETEAAAEADRTSPHDSKPQQPHQMSLFTEYVPHPAIDRLRDADLNALSPMQAFDLLRELIANVQDDEHEAR